MAQFSELQAAPKQQASAPSQLKPVPPELKKVQPFLRALYRTLRRKMGLDLANDRIHPVIATGRAWNPLNP
jgi:hypothetical protein